MPLAFPSHQGLVAPLWRRWPRYHSALAVCVGATVPDVVDGFLGLAVRGHLGQAYGHSLFGLFAICLPAGLALNAMIKALGRRARDPDVSFPARLSARIREWSALPPGAGPGRRFLIEAWSVGIGAFSHLLFDFVSHENFLWFYPWYEDPRFFPDWWYASWIELPVPFYERPYPVGPHFVVWLVLSILGAIMLFRGGRKVPA
jgi:Domain of unknown function (DUF4184)